MYYKKYFFTFRDVENKQYKVELHQQVDTTPIPIYVMSSAGSNVITETTNVDKYEIGDTLVLSTLPAGTTVVYINPHNNTVIVSNNASGGGAPLAGQLVKSAPVEAEITGGVDPVVIDFKNNSLYNAVRASGAKLSLLSETDRAFLSLYTDDMLKYRVLVYEVVQITPIYTQEFLIWTGYLDSENYSEDFSQLNNYEVSVTANDGLNLLDRIPYLNANGSHLTGMATQWETLLFCLYKINLPWEYLHVGLSSTIPGVVLAAGETILHKIFINNLNWYNEDDEPESCRKVLESILKPYGAFIIQQEGSLWITDSNFIANDATSFRRYLYIKDNTTYFDVYNHTFNLGDVSTIEMQADKSSFSIESGINRQRVIYSPYNLDKLLDYKSSEDTFTTEGTLHHYYEFGAPPAPVGDYDFDEQEYGLSGSFERFGNGRFVELRGIGLKNFGKKDKYLKLRPYENFATGWAQMNGRKCLVLTTQLPSIAGSEQFFLKLNMRIKATSSRYGNFSSDHGNAAFKEVKMHCDIIYTDIEGVQKKYIYWLGENDYNPTEYWSDNMEELSILQIRNKEQVMNDVEAELVKWNVLGNNILLEEKDFTIPINGMNLGTVSVIIYDYVLRRMDNSWFTGGYEFDPLPFGSLLISELGFSIVDKEGNEAESEDVEYVSKLNANFINEGNSITNYLGSNTEGYPCQRGNLMLKEDNFYSYLTELTKNGLTDIPERLLLRSIKSNHGTPNAVLECDLPVIKNLGYLTYNSYLPYKKMAVLSNTINLAENTSSVVLRELHADTATIVE